MKYIIVIIILTIVAFTITSFVSQKNQNIEKFQDGTITDVTQPASTNPNQNTNMPNESETTAPDGGENNLSTEMVLGQATQEQRGYLKEAIQHSISILKTGLDTEKRDLIIKSATDKKQRDYYASLPQEALAEAVPLFIEMSEDLLINLDKEETSVSAKQSVGGNYDFSVTYESGRTADVTITQSAENGWEITAKEF